MAKLTLTLSGIGEDITSTSNLNASNLERIQAFLAVEFSKDKNGDALTPRNQADAFLNSYKRRMLGEIRGFEQKIAMEDARNAVAGMLES